MNKPVDRIKISDCQVTGKTNAGILGGHYSVIDLGYWGKVPPFPCCPSLIARR